VGVSLLCPGGVRTNLAETGRSIGMTPEREISETKMAQSVQGGPEQDPDEVGAMVVRAIEADQFLILTDDVHADVIRRRAYDVNAFVENRLRAALDDGGPSSSA